MSNSNDDDNELLRNLRASGLKPILIDENTDFSKLGDLMKAQGMVVDMNKARAMAAELGANPFGEAQPKTEQGYYHKEAFCLMWYRCVRRPDQMIRQIPGAELHLSNRTGCGHAERMWNSRDGVTPFATSCPSCGGEMQHDRFDLDVCDPNHVPHPGQKIWVSMTKRRAEERVLARIEALKKHRKAWVTPEMDRDDYVNACIDHEWRHGTAPDLLYMPWNGDWNKIKPTLNTGE